MLQQIPSELVAAILTWGVMTLLARLGVALPMTRPTGKPDDPKTPEDESRKPYNPLDSIDYQVVIRTTVLEVLSQIFQKTPTEAHAKIEAALAEVKAPKA